VLVIGESGTGKELIARALHDHSPRAERPFVALNCGAISETLFESELFGHEKGAFTGADRRRDGAFHEAEGGTLFLDEVGELPEAAQAKLLRALETGEVRRVGSTKASTPDVRIVAATNRDLPKEVAAGRFREDLFFRLAVLSVDVPPLRQRKGDLGALCARLCAALGGRVRVTEEALEVLEQHDWPGNVRELRNVLTRAFVLGGPRIDVEHLSFHRIHPGHGPSHAGAVGASIEAQEKAFILAALSRHGDNRSAAARELGVARSTLHYKMKKFGIA
jgi:transcriptional regulator with PAS, ATPase and Fis domain